MSFTDAEMKRFWRAHGTCFRDLEVIGDQNGLRSICFQGEGFCYNRFFNFWQDRVCRQLLGKTNAAPGDRALDVGCGFGRWSRVLRDSGLKVTGVDLQETAILQNTKRLPECEFHVLPVEEVTPGGFGQFGLIVSVTVLQHMPYETQEAALRRLFSCLRPGGHRIFMEEILHKESPHLFSRSQEGWTRAF